MLVDTKCFVWSLCVYYVIYVQFVLVIREIPNYYLIFLKCRVEATSVSILKCVEGRKFSDKLHKPSSWFRSNRLQADYRHLLTSTFNGREHIQKRVTDKHLLCVRAEVLWYVMLCDGWVFTRILKDSVVLNPYPTAFPYGNGMVLHFYQQQESSTTKTVHKVINKGLKAYV